MPDYDRWYRRFFGLDSTASSEGGDERKPSSKGAAFASAGVEMAGGIGLFALLGWLVDRWLGTDPWGLVTGAVLGLVGGMYLIIKAAGR